MKQRKIRQRFYWRAVAIYGGGPQPRPHWWPFYGVKAVRVAQ